MNEIIQRAKAPTPKFFRLLRNIGLALAAASAVVITAPITLPAAVVTAAGYVAVAAGCSLCCKPGYRRVTTFHAKEERLMNERLGLRSALVGALVVGFIGGITREEFERTVVLATIGAAVSYLVTIIMKRITERRRK